MPRISLWFVRASLVYLVLAAIVGAALLWNKAIPLGAGGVWSLLPLHIEMSLIGWILQLVMGVAYWIFPRFGMTPAQRGREDLAWISFWLVNAGMWTAGLAGVAGASPRVLIGGRSAEVAATFLMALNIWSRTRRSGLSPM